MTVKELLHKRRAEIEKIAAKHGAFDIRVFGSVVRGEEKTDSDIDLLVKTDPPAARGRPRRQAAI